MNKVFYKSFIVLTFLLFVIINLTAMSCGKKSASQDPKQADKKKLPKETVELKLPKLLDLGAHKCIPCKKMEPILAELTEEYKGVFEVEFIDVWQPENKAKAQQHKIQSIPTQIFFDETGTEIWRHVGFISKEDILAKWVELGYDFSLQSSGSCIQECDNEALAEAEPFGCCGK